MLNFVRLPLEGAYNVRDLGGYPTKCGRMTKWHAFLRSDDPYDLTDSDIEFLKEYGLKTVIDLRAEDEMEAFPNPFERVEGVDYIKAPIFLDKIDHITRAASHYKPQDMITAFYLHLLTEARENIRKVFSSIAEAKEGAVMFHCKVGKDRTGIVAALLLMLCGVSRADIITNYSSSFHYIIQNPQIVKMIQNSIPDLFYSKPEYIEPVLDYIEKEHGNAKGYLMWIGLKEDEIKAIEKRLCE